MKIEKKKVSENSYLSKATKASIASMLGMSAILMSACGENNPVNGQIFDPTEGTDNNDSFTDLQNKSSSSVADIPLSHEAISSSVFEEFSSSATQPSKRSSSSYYISSGVSSASLPIPNSSSAAKPTSSATPPASSATEPASSAANSSSSSNVESPASSSSGNTVVPPWQKERTCEMQDSTGIHVIMCLDDDRGMVASMVSTYEMFDNV